MKLPKIRKNTHKNFVNYKNSAWMQEKMMRCYGLWDHDYKDDFAFVPFSGNRFFDYFFEVDATDDFICVRLFQVACKKGFVELEKGKENED
jgi:hypothetical protein